MKETRYTVKFSNHYWKVFDNQEYTDVKLHFLRTEAEKHAEYLNKGVV
jgi:hypothetical protein